MKNPKIIFSTLSRQFKAQGWSMTFNCVAEEGEKKRETIEVLLSKGEEKVKHRNTYSLHEGTEEEDRDQAIVQLVCQMIIFPYMRDS